MNTIYMVYSIPITRNTIHPYHNETYLSPSQWILYIQSIPITRLYIYTIYPHHNKYHLPHHNHNEYYLYILPIPSQWMLSIYTNYPITINTIYIYHLSHHNEYYLCIPSIPPQWILSIDTIYPNIMNTIYIYYLSHHNEYYLYIPSIPSQWILSIDTIYPITMNAIYIY